MDSSSDPGTNLSSADSQANSHSGEAYLRSIGALGLAEQIAQMRSALHVLELQAQRDYHLNAFDLHQMKEDRLLDDIMAVEAQQLAHGTTYNNVISGLGYAGFIAVLGVLKSVVPERDFLIVAMLFVVSLMSFVLWTAAIGVLIARGISKVAPLFDLPDSFMDRKEILEHFKRAHAARRNQAAHIQKYWALSFYSSVVTAVAAVFFLIGSLALTVAGSSSDLWGYVLVLMGAATGIEV